MALLRIVSAILGKRRSLRFGMDRKVDRQHKSLNCQCRRRRNHLKNPERHHQWRVRHRHPRCMNKTYTRRRTYYSCIWVTQLRR